MTIRVYRYGLLPPIESEALVRDQMHAAHRYRNTLVEIERARRDAVRAMMRQFGDLPSLEAEAAAAKTELDAAVSVVSAARAATRSRSETDEMKAAVSKARARVRERTAVVREARRVLRENRAVMEEKRRIDELAANLRRGARALCETYWGTYLLIESADMQARAMPLYDGIEPASPRFIHWAGEGSIGVQLQGGLAVPGVLGCESTQLRVEYVGPIWHTKRARTPKGPPRAQHLLWMRVGSQGREPVWARFPLVLHRPLPVGGTIKAASVSVHRHATHEEWSVQITVAEPPVQRRCGVGQVAIHLGWRLIDGGLRVAVAVGSDGARFECRLPDGWCEGMRKVDALRSLRDEKFNAALALLRESLQAAAGAPEWLLAATQQIALRRSLGRLASVGARWRSARFEGDSEAFEPLQAWMHRDRHLWQWECGLRLRLRRGRREIYRQFGAMLASRYETIVVEAFDLRQVAQRNVQVDRERPENEAARRNRQWAAVSELRGCVENAARGRGGDVCKEPSVDMTRTCHQCGLVEKFDAAVCVYHACSGCGAVWDEDDNAAGNLLLRYAARARDSQPPPSGRTSSDPAEPRWARARRMAAERRARSEIPPKPEGQVA